MKLTTSRDENSKLKLGKIEIDENQFNRARTIGDTWFKSVRNAILKISQAEDCMIAVERELEKLLEYEDRWYSHEGVRSKGKSIYKTIKRKK